MSDAETRARERLAHAGGPEEQTRLQAARCRAGQHDFTVAIMQLDDDLRTSIVGTMCAHCGKAEGE